MSNIINKTISIISRHNTLSEAVEAAKIDLSYNERIARQSIRDIETGFGRAAQGSGEAFVTNEGVFYIFHCDILLLNKFEPFHSCLDNSPFRSVEVSGNTITIGAVVRSTRREIGRSGQIVTKSY